MRTKNSKCRNILTIKRVSMAAVAGAMIMVMLPMINDGRTGIMTYAASSNSTTTSDSTSDTSSTDSSSASDEYSSATSTNPFLLPGNTWVTPVATHGQYVYVVLPLVNMFKYNIRDVVVTPVLSAKTDEWPFEIDATGYTEKIDTLVGEDAQADAAKRVQNCVWCFKTRDKVKTGYYKLDFTVTYTNPACSVETATISTYVKTAGLQENGTTDGDDQSKKTSTPRVIVKGFTTDPSEIYAGNKFNLTVTIENTSKDTAVNNLELDLTGTVAGKDDESSYAAFLPTSGSNSFYVDSIPAGGTTELSMEFQSKSDLEQKPYVMDIKMAYEDDEANAFTGDANVSIPIKQVSKFDMSTPDIEPSTIDIGGQSDVMFSIYNTGKTKLYNVSVTVSDPSVEPAMAYVGSLASGATGNVDMMVTGLQYPEDPGEGTMDCIISYEDESGNVTSMTKKINLVVQQDTSSMDYGDDTGSEEIPASTGLLLWQKAAIGAGAAVLLIVLIVITVKLIKRRKRIKEEKELADIDDDNDMDGTEERQDCAEEGSEGKKSDETK